MKAFFASLLLLLVASSAMAQGLTIDQLGAGGVLTGTEKIPMFQNSNPAVTTTPNALRTFMGINCVAGTCSLPPGSYVFVGPDGSTQFVTGSTNSAVEYIEALGGILGSGASLISRNSAQTGNVTLNFTSQGNANVNFGSSGSGQLVTAVDPAAPVSSGGQVQLTPSTASGVTKVGNSTYGVNLDCGTDQKCQAGGAPIQSAGGVYAFNINGDFQIDQPNEGATLATGNGRATDGWFANSSKGNILTYQRSTTAPTSIGPYYSSGTFTNGGAQVVGAADQVWVHSSVFAYDIAPALWGTANAKPLTLDICLMSDTAGLSYPALIPVSINNNAGAPNYQSYIHDVTLTAASAWTCTSITVAGPTNGTGFGNVFALNRVYIAIALGCGSNLQAAADQWVGPTTLMLCTAASTQLIATASAKLYITGVHLRDGTQNYLASPFQALPYVTELARARTRYWKSFAAGTKPAQNAGVNTGEIQFPAIVAGVGTQLAQTINLPQMVNPGAPTVTFFNPAAANANCRDETAAADGGAGTANNITSVGANSVTISCTGNAATAIANLIGVHMTVDSGL